MKLTCPHCGGRAYRLYLQSPEKGRKWIPLHGLLWCHDRREVVREEDQRRLPLILNVQR